MNFLNLTLLYFLLSVFSSDETLNSPSSSQTTIVEPMQDSVRTTQAAPGVILQSTDGGRTWQDISESLPGDVQPEGFFAGKSDLYVRVNNAMYRSKNGLKTSLWKKENDLDPRSTSIAFNPSGVMAFNVDGQIYKKTPSSKTWLPVYTKFKKHRVRRILETPDGTVFMTCDDGVYKSADGGQSWKHVLHEGWAMDIVESEGVLIGTGQRGIMRSTDNGEHWEWVISEGGVGIAVERIEGGFAVISYSGRTQSRRIRISMDAGKTWEIIDYGLPPSLSISSIKQIGNDLVVGHPAGIFRSSDMGKTWSMVHASVEISEFKYGKTFNMLYTGLGKTPVNSFNLIRKVFKIYASGNTLYAVAGSEGC